jgi:hypothetical protein
LLADDFGAYLVVVRGVADAVRGEQKARLVH